MSNFYNYLIQAGIGADQASWGCVIITSVVIIALACIILRLIPKKR